MITSKYPAKFLLFGQPFEYDAIQAWYGYFKVHKLLSAAINAKLHNFIEAVDSMNWFLDEL